MKINGNVIAFCCFMLALVMLEINDKPTGALWWLAVFWALFGNFTGPPDRPAT